MKSFDQYNYLAETIEKDFDFKIFISKWKSLDLLKDLSSVVDITTGFRKYTETKTKLLEPML